MSPLTCTECHGSGIVSSFRICPKPGPVDAPCQRCEGKGYLTSERHALLEAARRTREARNMRDLSLFECAKALGLKSRELSDAEHARLEFDRTLRIYGHVLELPRRLQA